MAVKAENQYLIQLGGVFNQALFTEFEGGDLTRGKEDYAKALTDDMGFVVGIISYGDITLRDAYNPEVHDDMIDRFLNYCGEPIDIVIQPVKICPERTPDGRAKTYTNCVPIYCTPVPSVNRAGSGVSKFELKFAVGGFKNG